MKLIKLSGQHGIGLYAKVDDEDFEFLSQHTWRVNDKGYVLSKIRNKHVKMHRLVMGAIEGQIIDHIDGDKLNMQKANLRFVTKDQSALNRRRSPKSSVPYKGIFKQKTKWRASIVINRVYYYITKLETPEEAALAYNAMARHLHGQYASLNELAGYEPTWNEIAHLIRVANFK